MASTILVTSLSESSSMRNKVRPFMPPVDIDGPVKISMADMAPNIVDDCEGKLLSNGKSVPDEPSSYEIQIESADQKQLDTFIQKVKAKRWTEKFVYVITVSTLSLLTHSVISAQYIIPYYYAISTPILLLIRTVMYFLCKWQYFLFDFCYYGNIICYVFIWAVPAQQEFFCILFALANGPMLWSLALFRNSLVFHNFDKAVSIYIHIMPSIVSFAIRWYPEEASKYWYTPFMPNFMDWTMSWLFGVPLACYMLHSLLYTLIIMYVVKPEENYPTVYRYLTAKEGSITYRAFNILGPKYRYWVYKVYYMGFCILSLLWTILWYKYYIAHACFLVFTALIVTYNGARYYLEVFSVRFKSKTPRSKEDSKDEDGT